MKRLLTLLLALALLIALQPSACAWDPDVDTWLVSTDGAPIPVYGKASAASKPLGTLVSGQKAWYDTTRQNYDQKGWIRLGGPVDAYVRAEFLRDSTPDGVKYSTWPSESAILPPAPARVLTAVGGARLMDGTGKKAKALGELPEGLRLMALGDFGDWWYAEIIGGEKGYLRKREAKETDETVENLNILPSIGIVTLYPADGVEGVPVYSGLDKTMGSLRSTRKDSNRRTALYQQGEGWAVINHWDGNWLVETRFLEEDGDHSLPAKYVVTSKPGNRLLLRETPERNDEYIAKLFSGAKLYCLCENGNWTAVSAGSYSGWVQTAYLSAERGTDMQPTVSVTDEYMSLRDLGDSLRADNRLTLIGSVDDSMIGLDAAGVCHTLPIEVLVRQDTGERLTAKAVSNVKLRLRAETFAKELCTIKKGQRVTVILQGDVWSRVEYQGQTGYVMTRYLGF
ncbi:MAG: SH3 domain-containing protein [Clostridia bacterium]|nr:SH3 domain-containing protein [Clostridia bacterium]